MHVIAPLHHESFVISGDSRVADGSKAKGINSNGSTAGPERCAIGSGPDHIFAPKTLKNRSEGFPNGIFRPCVCWRRGAGFRRNLPSLTEGGVEHSPPKSLFWWEILPFFVDGTFFPKVTFCWKFFPKVIYWWGILPNSHFW